MPIDYGDLDTEQLKDVNMHLLLQELDRYFAHTVYL